MSPAREQRLNWILPFALYAFFLWRSGYSMARLPLRILDWALPAVALGIWAAVRWRRREPWPRTAADGALFSLALVTAVTAGFSVNMRASLEGTWELWLGILILWAMVDAVRRGWAGVLWRVLYLMGGVVCLISALEFLAWYFGWRLLSTFQQGWPAIGGLTDPFPPTIHRLGLATGSITALSAFVALLIPPAITIALGSRQRDVRLGVLLWVVAAGAVEVLALSRGGFLSLGVSLTLLLLGSTAAPWFRRSWSTHQSKIRRCLFVGAILGALVAVLSAGFWVAVRFAGHASGDAVRMDLWRSALAMFLDEPLTGVGPAAYGTALRLYRDPLLARDYMHAAHNLYLHAGAEIGLFGLLAGAWLLLVLARAWWKRWRAEARGSASWWRILGAGAGLAGLAAQSLVDTFFEPAIVLPATFFVALILAPQRSRVPANGRLRRWPWAATLAVVVVGAAGLGWEGYGLAQFAQSLNWTQRGNLDKALPLAERARRHDPNIGLYACHAGYLYGRQQMVDTALARYEECLVETPVPGWVEQLNYAALLWQDGRQAQALAAVQQATSHTPLEWMPWLNRGLWAERMGKAEEAMEAYGWVLALSPGLAGSPFWQAQEQEGQWEAILDAGQQAAASLGRETAPWRWQVLLAAGKGQQAVTDLYAWLEAHPDDVEAMNWLGEALLGLEQPAEALPWLDRAVSAAPAQGRTYLIRGQAQMALERYNEAEQDLRTSLFLQPSDGVHLALARLAQRRGNEQAALQEYGRALRSLVMTQGYNVALYRRLGWPVPLPQVARIGYRHDREAALEWGALLEQQGEIDAAQRVYAMALNLDSYLDDVRQRMEKLAPGR